MPRKARVISQTGIYHVMLRGNNHQLIFKDSEDNIQFLTLFDRYRQECSISLYAWCLMPNHIHLLLKENDKPISQLFQKFGSSYVYWYNKKYDRIGHLFQDRFNSEPVENESYFLRAIRYIHMNPVKAKICDHPGSFQYSSYSNYFNGRKYERTDIVFGLIDIDSFEKFHFEKNDDRFLDIDNAEVTMLSDEEACKIIQDKFGCMKISEIATWPNDQKNLAIKLLRQSGASINQIRRLTRVNFGVKN